MYGQYTGRGKQCVHCTEVVHMSIIGDSTTYVHYCIILHTSGGRGAGGLLSISIGGPGGFGLLRGPNFRVRGSLFSYEGLFVGVAPGGVALPKVCCHGDDKGPFECWGTLFLVPGFGCSGGGAGFFPGRCGFGDGGRGAGGLLLGLLYPGERPPGVTSGLRGMFCLPPVGSRKGMGGACRGGMAGGVVRSGGGGGVDDVINDVAGDVIDDVIGGEGRRGLGGVCELSRASTDDVR